MVKYVTLYHGTTHLRKVLEGGIRPSENPEEDLEIPESAQWHNVVFLAKSLERAADYANEGIVEVKIPKNWIVAIEGDNIIIKRTIPPSMITRYWKNPKPWHISDINIWGLKFKTYNGTEYL